MKIRTAGFILLLMAQSVWAQRGIRLKNRLIVQPGQITRQAKILPAGAHHILQFNEFPGAATRSELARRHILVLGYVPDSALMVSSAEPIDLNGLDVTWSGQLSATDKLSPELATEAAGAYLVVFHADTDLLADRAVVQAQGFSVIENPYLLASQLLVQGAYSGIATLAENDAVAFILPASTDLMAGIPVMGCAGPITEAGAIAEYVEAGKGWSASSSGSVALQYDFQSLTSKLDQNLVKSEIQRAFREWQKYANISLSEGAQADAVRTISIQFARGAHGDAYPFDGPGGVLAHTFYPVPLNSEPVAGDMHLDADEDWHVGTRTDLYSVVLHEAGHALGLGHTGQSAAVMYPYYHLSSGLTADDIAGIQDLYGAPQSQTPVTPPVQPPTTPPVIPPVTPPVIPPVTPPVTPATPPVQPPVTPPANPSGADTISPTLRIVSPATTMFPTSSPSVLFTGTASDNVGVVQVKWSTSNGDLGTASGTTTWSADVPVLVGSTIVTVRAYDAAGNSGWRSVSVVRH